MSTEIDLVIEEAEDAGERADVVLGRRVPQLSRRAARRMALEGRLSIDGRRARPSDRVKLGSRLELHWDGAPVQGPEASVLQVTDDYVFLGKPAAVHTHRLRPDQAPALADFVATLHPECAGASTDPREGGAVHRLDHDTTGVVAFARTREAWISAREAFAEGRVRKSYLALCHGGDPWPPPDPADTLPGWISPGETPDELVIRAPVGRGESRSRAAVTLRGQPAHTRVRPLRTSGDGAHVLCSLDLVTGRRHQARLHLAWLGLPIVGDTLYGSTGVRPMLLHAAALEMVGLAPRVEAEPPPAFRAAITRLGLAAADG